MVEVEKAGVQALYSIVQNFQVGVYLLLLLMSKITIKRHGHEQLYEEW